MTANKFPDSCRFSRSPSIVQLGHHWTLADVENSTQEFALCEEAIKSLATKSMQRLSLYGTICRQSIRDACYNAIHLSDVYVYVKHLSGVG